MVSTLLWITLAILSSLLFFLWKIGYFVRLAPTVAVLKDEEMMYKQFVGRKEDVGK